MAIVFNGNTVPTGIEVSNITKSVMPPINVGKLSIAGRDGAYNLNKRFGERDILIEFVITATSYENLAEQVRELIDFLYTDEPETLFINNEPTKYYLAMVESVADIDEISDLVATVEVLFRCSNPFSYDVASQTPVSLTVDGTETTVTNNGDITAYPLFEVEIDGDCTYIGLANTTTGEQMYIGSPVAVGETPYALQTTLFTGSLSSLSEMTQVAIDTANYLDSGTIKATHTLRTTTIAGSSQTGYGLGAGGYGTDTGWHGAVSEKTLASAQDNFSVTWDLQYKPSAVDNTGRSELYLYDGTTANPATATRMAKLTFQDSNDGITCPQLWFKIYDGTGVADSDVLFSGVTGVSSLVDESKNRNCNYYQNPDGLIRIRVARRSNPDGDYVWNVWVALIDPTSGNHSEVLRQDLFTYVDTFATSQALDMGYFYISSLAYGTVTAPTEFIHHTLRVFEEDVDSTGTPYIFEDGDLVLIDSSRGMILKNGEPFFTFLDPTSTFPRLIKGANEVVVVGDSGNFINAQVTKNERYL